MIDRDGWMGQHGLAPGKSGEFNNDSASQLSYPFESAFWAKDAASPIRADTWTTALAMRARNPLD
jgi:hypothetical protein